jgi:DNA-binding SARP family transcriptional activator/tetratricopeptide (TPR) repeat protein
MAVEINGRLIVPSRRRGKMLLAYQIANRSRPLRRDELEQVLWEDERPADPSRSLSAELSHLRRKLRPEVLPTDEVSLRLPQEATVDVELIEERAQQTLQALKEGRPAKAVVLADEALELLDQKFLPELEAKWIDERRRELDEWGLSVRRASVEARLQLGGEELEQAERTARELVDRAPYRESGHKLLMQVLAARGDVAEAVLVYDRLRRLLLDELGKAPDPSITELNAMLLEGTLPEPASAAAGGALPMSAAGPGPRPTQLPLPPLLDSRGERGFVGREEPMSLLSRQWERASIKPRVAVLSGEPGIGKTRVAACFGQSVHRTGATVLYGRCHEDRLSFQPFVEALGHYAGAHDLPRELPEVAEQLWRCVPPLRHLLREAEPSDHAPGPEDRYALFEALTAVLRHAAEARPLLLVIDDLHWANTATFDLLLHSKRSLTPSQCMFLVTSREAADPGAGVSADPEESLEARLDALRREADFEHVCLEGLDEREAAELIEARSGVTRSEGFARGLWRRTGGNPLFIEEMLPLVEGSEEPDLSRIGVPEAVEHAIIRRLEHLADSSREALAAAAVIGPEFTLSVLAAVLERSVDDTLAEVEELIRYGLVVEVPDKRDHFAFWHALVRETQYLSLIASRRARIHRRVALELERMAADPAAVDRVSPAELAQHFYEARPTVEPRHAAGYSEAAAKDAEHGAGYEEAGGHYDCAIELLRTAGAYEDEICDLLIAQGKAWLRAGRLVEARRSFGEAAAIARRTGEAEKLARAALGFHGRYLSAGEVPEDVIGLLEEALEELDPGHSALRARALARLADSLMWADTDRQLGLSIDALRMARALGHPLAMLEALAARHTALLHTEHLDARLELGTERLELARGTGSDEAIAAALRWTIHDLCELGDLRSAKEHYVELAELADGLRQPLYLSYARHWECVFAQVHGRLDEAERSADAAFDLATRVSARDAEMSRVDKRSAIYREQGQLTALHKAIERCAVENPGIPAWWALLALVYAEGGDTASARAQVDRLVANDAAALPRDVFWLYGLALLAETCALLEDAAGPASVLNRLLIPYADRYVQVGMDTFWGSVWRFVGLTATATEDWSAAADAYAEAARRHEQLGSAPLLARTRMNQAQMLLRRGKGEAEALRLLAQVKEAADSLDLAQLGRRAEALQAGAAASVAPV